MEWGDRSWMETRQAGGVGRRILAAVAPPPPLQDAPTHSVRHSHARGTAHAPSCGCGVGFSRPKFAGHHGLRSRPRLNGWVHVRQFLGAPEPRSIAEAVG